MCSYRWTENVWTLYDSSSEIDPLANLLKSDTSSLFKKKMSKLILIMMIMITIITKTETDGDLFLDFKFHKNLTWTTKYSFVIFLCRMIYTECSPGLCPCGDSCMNNRFQKHLWAPCLEMFLTPDRGYGVRSSHHLMSGKKNKFIFLSPFNALYFSKIIFFRWITKNFNLFLIKLFYISETIS